MYSARKKYTKNPSLSLFDLYVSGESPFNTVFSTSTYKYPSKTGRLGCFKVGNSLMCTLYRSPDNLESLKDGPMTFMLTDVLGTRTL